MNPEQTQQILNGLKGVAEKLGTAASNVWAIYVRQALVSGITDIVLYALLLSAIVAWVKALKWAHTNGRFEDCSTDVFYFIGFAATGILLGITLVAAFFAISDTVTALVNPQFWALQKLLETVKK
jgi:hypothetical protein